MTEENLFETLTEQEKGVLITAAIQFKSVITELFGEDYSEEAFNKVADSVLPSLKYELLKNALTNKYSLFVTVHNAPSFGYNSDNIIVWGYQKVPAIKAIRTYSADRMGLKEAKDICDNAEKNISTHIKVKSIEDRNQLIKELIGAGMNVS